MGKKGSWFSAIKKVFTHNSKDKQTDVTSSDKKSSREKKKGKGLLRHSETRSFIPLFKEPSSIEKILGEADQLLIRPPITTTASSEQQHQQFLRTDFLEKPPSPRRIASSDSLALNGPSSSSSLRVNNNISSARGDSSPKSESAPSKAPASPKAAVALSKAISASKAESSLLRASAASKAESTPLRASVASKAESTPLRASTASKAVPQKAFAPSSTSSKQAHEANNPKVTERESRKQVSPYVHRPEPTLRYQNLSATKIQAAFRGYLARRSFRALRGLVRLQGVVRGQNVKRQTANTMKQMQLLVRVQTQIQSRRIQMLENQVIQHQAHQNQKEVESTISKWTNQLSEMDEDWDDSVLTKEEADTRLRKKVEAVIKRERAMAYAYSNKLWRGNPNSAQTYQDIRSNGFPWWWNWLERQLPETTTSTSQNQRIHPKNNFNLTPPRAVSEYSSNINKRPAHSTQYCNNSRPMNIPTPDNNHDSVTPRSTNSQAISIRGKQFHTPSRTPPPQQPYNYHSSASSVKYSRREVNTSYNDVPLRDDDSLVSCPPFSAPSYMMPTVSAKAKVRSNSNPKERFMGTPGSESKKRFSFPLTPKWNNGKGSVSSNQRVLEKHDSSRSIGDMSVDSTVSMPAIVGRKPFNRFV